MVEEYSTLGDSVKGPSARGSGRARPPRYPGGGAGGTGSGLAPAAEIAGLPGTRTSMYPVLLPSARTLARTARNTEFLAAINSAAP